MSDGLLRFLFALGVASAGIIGCMVLVLYWYDDTDKRDGA